jgi:hypothetical protein
MDEYRKKLIRTSDNLSALRGEVIFDAERDNSGKGIPVDEMIKMLKKIKHG